MRICVRKTFQNLLNRGKSAETRRLKTFQFQQVVYLEEARKLVHPVNKYELLRDLPPHEENGGEVFSG